MLRWFDGNKPAASGWIKKPIRVFANDMTSTDALAEAKQRLRIPELWRLLGVPGSPAKSCRVPWREDKTPSGSVYDDGLRFHDFGTGEDFDAIDFLARARGLSLADAIREFKKLAGVGASLPTEPPSRSNSIPANAQPAIHIAQPFDWAACVAAFTPEHRAKLTEWRGYSPKFVDWLHAQKFIGLFEGERIAFPVHDSEAGVIACHYRLKEDGSWRYHPAGTHTAPFIIGAIAAAEAIFCAESQWDLFAILDSLHWHIQPDGATAALATRGASNGRLVAGRGRPDATVYAFAQNDAAGEKWLAAVVAACGCKSFHVVTPAPHKDPNDWTKAGATADDLRRAIADAKPYIPPPDLHAAPPRHVSKPVITLPPGDETDDAPQPFPVESLAPALASMVAAVARCERVPTALPAVCALGVASAAIGAGLEIVSATDRETRANLFLLGSAESGSGKSQVFRRIAQPIVEHQHALHEAHHEKIAPHLASEIAVLTREMNSLEKKAAKSTDTADRERVLGELEFKNARRAELQQKNTPPCLVCGDVTSEKLAVLMAANRETLFSASSEARQIVDIVCGRYNSTKSTDEAIYLSGFSGDFLRVDRLGRDPLTLRRPCLSVLWLVQPDAMGRLFETETLAQSGFLPRFLVCHTQAAPQKIVEGESQAVSDAIRAQWTGLIDDLLATYHAAEKPYRVEPSPEAKRLLDDFFNAVVDRRTGDLADVGQFASRYGEQAWRVALTSHGALYGRDAHNHPLDAETAQNAVSVVRWFVDSQLTVLAHGRRQAATEIADKVLELLEINRTRKGKDYLSAREVQQAHIVNNAEVARALLDRMEREGLLSGEDTKPEHGGWARRIYRAIKNLVPD